MTNRNWSRIALLLIAIATAAVPAAAQQNLFDAISFRSIGPTRQSGRFVEFAVVEAKPHIYYAASATGGVFKTENNGITFTEIFNSQHIASVGAVAVSQSNNDIVYVGSGEGNNSRSTYYGNGVYKSTDAGRTWTNVGLPNSGHIARIVVHPTKPEIVFVAAVGHLYSENPDRGLYRSIDGGANWTKVLDHKVDGRSIGVIEVVMDPANPQVLYAATYDKVRRPWSFAEGGPGSAIFKSTDGGAKWTQLTTGLPSGFLGRIGLSIARSDPKTVYAVVENVNAPNVPADQRKARLALGYSENSIGDQFFRSDDAGKTWKEVSPSGLAAPSQAEADSAAGGRGGRGAADSAGAGRGGAGGGRGGRGGGGFTGANPPYYYGQIRVDPNNKEHIYLLSVGVSHSTDGGKTWSSPFNFGGDNHALWIDPKNSDHMLLGYDHGMGVTFDGGRNWLHPDNLNLGQFYAITFDMERPYNVYGGLQDNGSVRGPSSNRTGGISFEDWYTTGGGDGMYSAVDWKEGRFLYNESQFGAIQRRDQWTGESRGITYTRAGRGGRGGGGGGAGGGGRGGGGVPACADPNTIRWNWASPILVSPHNPDVVYHAGSILLRSPFRGESWEEISPDLTVNDSTKRCGTGNIQYATISTIDESTIVPGLLWVGTDDGNVQVTRDGGRNWTNVRSKITGHPGYWVSRVEAGHHDAGVAYVSVTGLRHDDFKPYLWKTTDYGNTWTSIAGNLPNESVNVIRESRQNPNLLFVGTDLGVYATLDGGRTWNRMKTGMPSNPVHDLQVHPRDEELIVGTHGRGIYIADVSALDELTPAVMNADAYLMAPIPTVQWAGVPRPVSASNNYPGQSRPAGMAISYYAKAAGGNATIRVYDGARVIAEVSCPTVAGVQTVRWSMQARRELTEAERNAAGGGRGGRGGGGAAGGRGGAGGAGGPSPCGGGGAGGPGAGGGRGGRGGGGGGAATFPVAGDGVLSTVQPGEYRIELTVGSNKYTTKGTVLEDMWYRR